MTFVRGSHFFLGCLLMGLMPGLTTTAGREDPSTSTASTVMTGNTAGNVDTVPSPPAVATGFTPPPIRIVYFTPRDGIPAPNAPERLTRVLTDVQNFYRSEMIRHGYGPLTFAFDGDSAGRLRIHYVSGERRREEYSRGDYEAIRREVTTALLREERGDSSDSQTDTASGPLYLDREIVVIFQRLLAWDDGRVVTSGPFAGSGNHRFGVAFVYDDERLDSALLSSREPAETSWTEEGTNGTSSVSVPSDPTASGSERRDLLSLGGFNSRYIGGLAHELGHAFGLTHNAETSAERAELGISLMGVGNNVYGRSRRGEGTDPFITASDALLLSRCRAFVGDLSMAHLRPQWRFLALSASFQKTSENSGTEEGTLTSTSSELSNPPDSPKTSTSSESLPLPESSESPVFADERLVIRGRIESNIPLIGVIAYNDDTAVPGDYDAVAFVAKPDTDGVFRLSISDLKKTEYQMRLVGVGVNGATFSSEVTWRVDENFSPGGLVRFNSFALETLFRRLFASWNVKRVGEVVEELERRRNSVDPDLIRKGKFLHRLMSQPATPVSPDRVGEDVKSLDLADAQWLAAKNGLGRPLRKIVPDDLFITVEGRFFTSGLFAHAPSIYRFRLGGFWDELSIGYGIVDGRCGSAVFQIVGDGRELWKSSVVTDNRFRETTVSVGGVHELDLIVDPTSDGKSRDWSIWLNPILRR